jgi:predicted metalloendopeptidase
LNRGGFLSKPTIASLSYQGTSADLTKHLTINETNFLQSVTAIATYKEKLQRARLHKPVNRTDWVDNALYTKVNAFYNPSLTYILIPAAILQENFYSTDWPS